VKVWCLATKMLKATLMGHDHVVECVLWVPEALTPAIISSAAVKEFQSPERNLYTVFKS